MPICLEEGRRKIQLQLSVSGNNKTAKPMDSHGSEL